MTSLSRPLKTVRLQYFLYFGVLGIYLPYFNLYCYHIGFGGTQIGALSAARSLVMVLFSLLWGVLADRFQTRRPIYLLCSFLSAFAWALFLATTAFWPMFAVTILYVVFYAPLISFLEAATMDVLAQRKQAYGSVRAWGSIGFILVVLILGALIDRFPIRWILVLVLVGSLLQAVAALGMPGGSGSHRRIRSPAFGKLFNLPTAIFLVCGFLMLVSHGAYYGFFSIHLETLGHSRTFIGFAWALASTAEILVMVKSEALFKRFSLESVLLGSFAVAGLRWLLLYVASAPALILAAQLLHAVTYGAFHMASILYIDRLAPEAGKTFGQAVNNAVQYGLGLMCGFLANGLLYERFGSRTLFLVSALTAVAGGMLFRAGTLVGRAR
jgi:PPP family 3-phenylpropionic acid transporter